MNKQLKTYSAVAALVVMTILSGCNKGEIDFSYTPAEPCCGQTISFSNASTKGDSDSKWEWVFGDGATSTLKSPSKIYRKAGTYMVTLTLDGKKYQKVAKEIVVYDSIPSFSCSAEGDSIGTYEQVTFKALTYNPYNLALSYQWQLPESAQVLTDDVTSESLQVYFTQPVDSASVTLITTLGGVESIKTQKFHISRSPAQSLIISTPDNQLLRQRIYSLDIAQPDTITPQNIDLSNVTQLITSGDMLYIFNMAAGDKGAIYAYDMQADNLQIVIKCESGVAECPFMSGALAGDYLYFADEGNKHIYRLPLTARNQVFTDGTEQLFAQTDALTGFETGTCSGIGIYGELICIGANNGIYRFTEADINSGVAPATSVLGENAVSALKIDQMAGKIYSVEEGKLMVRNIDGTYPAELAAFVALPSLLNISNKKNKVVYGTDTDVWSLPLVQTRNNTTTAVGSLLTEITATAIAIDDVER